MAAPARTLEEMIAEVVETTVRRVVREELGRSAPDVMDTAQASAYTGRSAKTIRAWISDGMPATRKGARLTVRREDLDRWRAGAPDEEREATAAAVRRLTGT